MLGWKPTGLCPSGNGGSNLLRLDEPPCADPHARWCGSWGRNTPGYPISVRKPLLFIRSINEYGSQVCLHSQFASMISWIFGLPSSVSFSSPRVCFNCAFIFAMVALYTGLAYWFFISKGSFSKS